MNIPIRAGEWGGKKSMKSRRPEGGKTYQIVNRNLNI